MRRGKRDDGSRTPVEMSVVIPARNAGDTLDQQLYALVSQIRTDDTEVLVVDNRSSDSTAQVARAYSQDHHCVRLLDGHGGLGPAYARNLGARCARGPLLAFCDADDVVAGSWVAGMRRALSVHDFVTGPVGLGALNPEWMVRSRGQAAGARPSVFEDIFPYASSCNLGVRSAVFDLVGGFDEGMTVGEDLDLSLRLWLAGVPLHFDPDVAVEYRYRHTASALFGQARAYGRVRPLLAEKLRSAGLPAPRRAAGARNWGWLARHLPALATRTGRSRWLWVAGTRVGNLEGSARARRVYL